MKGSSLVEASVRSKQGRAKRVGDRSADDVPFRNQIGMTSIINLVVSASDIVLSVSTADTYYADTRTLKTADGADSTFSGHRHSRPR